MWAAASRHRVVASASAACCFCATTTASTATAGETMATHGLLGRSHSFDANGLALHFDAVDGAEAERLKRADPLAGDLPVWTGQYLWKSGGELAKFVVRQGTHFWEGKRVIELGCGCGMAGLTAAAMGAEYVCLTDQVIAGAERNLSVNVKAFPELGAGLVECKRLDWGDDAMVAATAPPFDVILGSDILQEGGDIVGSFELLAKTLVALSKPPPGEEQAAMATSGDRHPSIHSLPPLPETTVYLCNPIGNPAKLAAFFELMKSEGFDARVVVPPRGFDPIAVLRMSRPAATSASSGE